jgi:hypothetical protein
MTFNEFIAMYRVKFKVERSDDNPYMPDMPSGSKHYKCKLWRYLDGKRRQMTIHFSMGPPHRNPPTVEEVLDCLADDAASIENADDFDAWCNELGYPVWMGREENQNARRSYAGTIHNTKKLKDLFLDEFDSLLYHTERGEKTLSLSSFN